MNRLLVIFLFTLITNISLAQTGWGYVNYTSYKTHGGAGWTNQYGAFPYNAAEFDNMLNTANSNTTITHTGEVTLATMCEGSTATPHWGADYYAIKFEFWFIPQETGTYTFGVNSDDASDLSIDGTIITTYYGGHGASGYQLGTKAMIAGQRYKIIARYQEFGGGDVLYVRWSRPSAPNNYSYWTNEVTNVNSEPAKKVQMNFDFGSSVDETKFAIGSALSSTGWIDVTGVLDTIKTQNAYKPQSVKITTTNSVSTLYNSIVTVSDVWLAFKEIANVGILGNQSGNEFGYGIQYKNADVNDDGIFNEADCFRLLQHLTGVKNIVDTFNLNKTIKLIPYSVYRTIGKSNWNSSEVYLGDTYNFDINTGKTTDTFNVSVTWKGDVNLSHSATPPPNGITTSAANFGMQVKLNEPSAYVVSELMGDSLIFIIKLNPNSNKIGGTQFQINYDNSVLTFNGAQFKTIGSFTNFSTNNKSYITIGSLNITDGFLNDTTEYRLSFKTIQNLENSIGLVSIATTEAVSVDGKTMKIKIQ